MLNSNRAGNVVKHILVFKVGIQMVGNGFLVNPDFSETMIANTLAEASE